MSLWILVINETIVLSLHVVQVTDFAMLWLSTWDNQPSYLVLDSSLKSCSVISVNFRVGVHIAAADIVS